MPNWIIQSAQRFMSWLNASRGIVIFSLLVLAIWILIFFKGQELGPRLEAIPAYLIALSLFLLVLLLIVWHWQGFREWILDARPHLIVGGLVLLFILLFEYPKVVVVIHSGQLGVEYKTFSGGTITDYLYPEGVHLMFPWNTMFVYDTRVQERKEVIPVLTKDGLEVEIDLSIRYHPESTMLGVLHQEIGPDYANIVVIPEVESAVRTSLGKLTIEQLYGGRTRSNEVAVASTTSAGAGPPNTATAAAQPGGEALGTVDTSLVDAIEDATDQASKKYILIDNVIVTQIHIPDYVQKAIQKKVEQEEVLETQDYRLQQAIKEKDIATNQAAANDTLKQSLDANLLKLRGIEATEKLAQSPNTKVVIVGNGTSGLPVILGSDK